MTYLAFFKLLLFSLQIIWRNSTLRFDILVPFNIIMYVKSHDQRLTP